MTLFQKMMIAGAAAFAAVALYAGLSKNATLEYLLERYPHLDPEEAKRAYDKIMSMALRQEIDFSNWSEQQFNDLFLNEVARLHLAK